MAVDVYILKQDYVHPRMFEMYLIQCVPLLLFLQIHQSL